MPSSLISALLTLRVGGEGQKLDVRLKYAALSRNCDAVEGKKLPIQVKRHNPKDHQPQQVGPSE
jgi:hypothetical protein